MTKPELPNWVDISTLFVAFAGLIFSGVAQYRLNEVQTQIAVSEASGAIEYRYVTIRLGDFCREFATDMGASSDDYQANLSRSIENGYIRNNVVEFTKLYLDKKYCKGILGSEIQLARPSTLAFIEISPSGSKWAPRVEVSGSEVTRDGANGIWTYKSARGPLSSLFVGPIDSSVITRIPIAVLDPRGTPLSSIIVPHEISWTSPVTRRAVSLAPDFIQDEKFWRGRSDGMWYAGQ